MDRVRALRDAVAAWRRTLSPVIADAVDARAAAELLAEVLADPTDDAPRHVYADWLIARGDPRGELIQLQLAGGSEEAEKRARALLRAHQKQWLGPDLACVLTQVRFARGFLDRAELARNSVADEERWQRAARDPVLATVTRLGFGRGNARHYEAFAAGGALRALEALEVPGPPFLRTLAALPIREQLRRLDLHELPPAKDLRGLTGAFPRLDALSVRLQAGGRCDVQETLAPLRESGVLGRLRALGIVGLSDTAVVRAMWAELPPNVERLTFGWLEPHELRREQGRLVLRVAVAVGLLSPRDLAALAPGVVEVELVGGSDADAETLTREAAELGLRVVRVEGDASPRPPPSNPLARFR